MLLNQCCLSWADLPDAFFPQGRAAATAERAVLQRETRARGVITHCP